MMSAEVEFLKSFWHEPPVRRNRQLIVPKVTFEKNTGSLNNDHWAFKVPYAFRDALDIQFQPLTKDKLVYTVWTQGFRIDFHVGDVLVSQDGKRCLQVHYAQPMGWDIDSNSMFEGIVDYKEYASGILQGEHERFACSQMQFLNILITGTR